MPEKLQQLLKHWELILFPECEIFNNKISPGKQFILFGVLSFFFSFAGIILKPGGMIGFDWIQFYSQGIVPPFYPPWTQVIVESLTWPLLIGITLSGFAIAAIKRAVHPISVVVAFFSLPLMWTLFLGQLEGIVLVGLLGIPWLAPLALIKPQVSIFAFGESKKYLLVVIIFLMLSLLLWGLWPLQTLNVESFYAEGRYTQNIGLGWWGLPIALITLWFSRGDMDMLMLSGTFLLPHLIPYNLLPVVPAVARLRPAVAIIVVVFSWAPFLANWIGPFGWWLGWLYILLLWGCLAVVRYSDTPFIHRFVYIFKK